MSDEWVQKTLGEVAEITIGKTPPRGDQKYWTDSIQFPFCTIADMTGAEIDPRREGVTTAAISDGKAKRVPTGSLLMSFKLSIGRIGFAARDIFPNEAIAWLEPKSENLDKRYLGYWLSAQDLTAGASRAAKGFTLNGPSMRAISVRIPSLPVQRRIVDLMTHLDTHIANLQAERGTLGLLASNHRDAVLNGWLQNDCEEATLASSAIRPPDYGLGLAATEMSDGQKYLRTTDVISGRINWDGVRYCDASEGEQRKAALFDGDIVVARTGANAGASALVQDPPDGAVFAGYLVRFRPDASRFDSGFVAQVLQSSLWSDYVQRTRTGSAQPQFNAKLMGAFFLPSPSLAKQQGFAESLSRIEEVIRSLQSEERVLSEVRSAALSSLLTGDLRLVAAYDSLIAEAA